MSLISFQNVTLGYEGVPVIKDLNFDVERGDYLCVIGENGSGKSTMMKAMLGFISPMSGKIVKDRSLKNAIGYLPQQQPAQADFPASVFEVVLSGCQGRKKVFSFYNGADRKLAEKSLEIMNIASLRNRSFRELSGGQKQRALLARAMCAAEGLMLLDEPVAGLDPAASAELYATIDELHKNGMTIIMITHDTDHVLSASTHVLQLGQTMLFYGKTADYLSALRREINAQ